MTQVPSGKRASVLLVQRDAAERLELAARLAELGLTALEASDADQAITVLEAYTSIGLLLTDIKMSGSMDGIRLAHHVRERWPNVRIIVTSDLVGTQFSDLPPGAIFVNKPYRPESLDNAVSYMMGRRRRWIDPQPEIYL